MHWPRDDADWRRSCDEKSVQPRTIELRNRPLSSRFSGISQTDASLRILSFHSNYSVLLLVWYLKIFLPIMRFYCVSNMESVWNFKFGRFFIIKVFNNWMLLYRPVIRQFEYPNIDKYFIIGIIEKVAIFCYLNIFS